MHLKSKIALPRSIYVWRRCLFFGETGGAFSRLDFAEFTLGWVVCGDRGGLGTFAELSQVAEFTVWQFDVADGFIVGLGRAAY